MVVKPMVQPMEEKAKLKATLSFPVILIITINSIMGTGIFFLPAQGAHVSGNMSILAWAAMSVIAILLSLVFAELAGMFPKSGGIYEYCKQAFGSFPSFVIGWLTIIAGNVTIAMLVIGAIQYLNPGMAGLYKVGLSIVFILIFNFMTFKGMQTSSFMLVTFGLITLSSLFLLIVPNFLSFDTGNFVPFLDHDYTAVFLTVFLIAETFFGWETCTFLAEETKNPRKVLPLALILGTVAIVIICLLFVISSLGAVPAHEFGESSTPLALLAGLHFGAQGTSIFKILVYLSIIGSVAGWIVAAPRLIMALAKDKLFISQLADIHPVTNTPYKAIIFQTIITSVLVMIGAGSYNTLLHLLLPLVLVIYSATVLALIVLRRTKPDHERPFKMPLGKTLSFLLIIGILFLIGNWAFTDPGAFMIIRWGFSFFLLGIPIYMLLLIYYNPEAIIRATNFFSYFHYWLENVLLPHDVRKHILGTFKNMRNKIMLDFGAGVGTMTMHLANLVGSQGKIYATDISRRNVKILGKRLKKKGYHHVEVLHDAHQVNRIHPGVRGVHGVLSIGMLAYMQDVKKILHELHDIMPDGGEVCFVEYIDFFKFLPNPKWLNDYASIQNFFKEAGFSVHSLKIQGLFWDYLIVYGIKTQFDVPFV